MASQNIVVFTGPTISASDAKIILPDAIFLDPVSQGDVYSAFKKYNPIIIGIIDGYFEGTPAIWHKEILFAMSKGVHVYGSSSMGALRAAELSDFGMEGIGKIFNAYKQKIIEDDDEVAVFHGPKELGYPNLSEPMVNIRQTCLAAFEQKIISLSFYEELLDIAKQTYYKKRNYHNVLNNAKLSQNFDEVARFRTWLTSGYQNIKRDDAIQLLENIKKACTDGLEPKKVSYHFERTFVWENAIHSI